MAQNIIILNKGDTFDFYITAFEHEGGKLAALVQKNDIIEFKVLYPNQDYFDSDQNIPIVKRYTIESDDASSTLKSTINIEHWDTINLKPGVYYYTVKLKRPLTPEEQSAFETELVDIPVEHRAQYVTIINRTKFVLNG